MDDVEIPKFFICPISLQIMKDPVTAITGITYDRESIELWQSSGRSNTCPVTNQPLPLDSSLTPNHTLRRLIQSWCISKGIDHIATLSPNPPLKKSLIINLLKNLNQETLEKLEKVTVAAAENGGDDNNANMTCLQEAGVIAAMVHFIGECHRQGKTLGLKESLRILYLVGIKSNQMMFMFKEYEQIIDSLTWVLGLDRNEVCNNGESFKIHAVFLLKFLIDKANPGVLERLRPDMFKQLILVLKERENAAQTKAALDIMLRCCQCGRNRISMVESDTIHELIELGLICHDKSTTESIFGVLFHLCSCADGRDQLLSHKDGLAFVTRKLLKVSLKADDRIMLIVSLISKFSGTNGVVQEMLRLGTVSKLCMVLHYDRPLYLKERAKEILRTHFDAWKNTECIMVSISKFSL